MEPENWDLEDDFPFQTGHLRVPCYFPGWYASNPEVMNDQESRWKSDIFPALVASSWKAASSSSQACNLHWSSGCNMSNSRSWPYYCLPSKRGGSSIKACTFLIQVERERERERVWKEIQVQYMKYNGAWFLITGVVLKVKDQVNQRYTLNRSATRISIKHVTRQGPKEKEKNY